MGRHSVLNGQKDRHLSRKILAGQKRREENGFATVSRKKENALSRYGNSRRK